MRIRPQRNAWLVLGALFVLVGLPAIGLGVAWLAGGNPVAWVGVPHGDTVAAIVSLAVGLSFLMPAAYFLRAEVTVRDGVLAKVVLFWMVSSCPVESLSSITRYVKTDLRGSTRATGYEFKLADGASIFELSSAWWSSKDIAQLGQRLGIVISGGNAAVEQRRLVLRGTPLESNMDPGFIADELWDVYSNLVASPPVTDYRKTMRAAAETNRWTALLCTCQLMTLNSLWPSHRGWDHVAEIISKAEPSEAGVAKAIDEIRALATARTGRLAASLHAALNGSADPYDRLVTLELEVKARAIKQEKAATREGNVAFAISLSAGILSSAVVLVYCLATRRSIVVALVWPVVLGVLIFFVITLAMVFIVAVRDWNRERSDASSGASP